MTTTSSNAAQTPPGQPSIKSRQQATWASGDYAVIGTTLQIVGEQLCEAVDVCAGERVLDVAAGNGNATLAAARRFAQVTSTAWRSSSRDDDIGGAWDHVRRGTDGPGRSGGSNGHRSANF